MKVIERLEKDLNAPYIKNYRKINNRCNLEIEADRKKEETI